jgi:outer membrane lipoprotein carrier protein
MQIRVIDQRNSMFRCGKLLGLLLLCISTCANAAMDQPGRDQLNLFAQGLDTMQATFEQRVVRSDGSLENESSGEVWLRSPHYFHWAYGGDFPEQVIADGQRIWIYDEILEQVTVKSQAEFNDDSPLIILTDIQRLDELFEVREAGDMDGMVLLELRSVDAESEFDRVLVGLSNGQLQLLAMEDAFGMRTEIRFTAMQRNPALDDSLFEFSPPPGVDVIGAEDLMQP